MLSVYLMLIFVLNCDLGRITASQSETKNRHIKASAKYNRGNSEKVLRLLQASHVYHLKDAQILHILYKELLIKVSNNIFVSVEPIESRTVGKNTHRRLYVSGQDLESDWREDSGSESHTLLKRDSSLITETHGQTERRFRRKCIDLVTSSASHCGALTRQRCYSIPLRRCYPMCVDGRRQTLVCKVLKRGRYQCLIRRRRRQSL